MKEQIILQDLIERYPILCDVKEDIYSMFHILLECYLQKGKVLICGNGGSTADSDHIVGELMKGFIKERHLEKDEMEIFEKYGEEYKQIAGNLQKALPAISLTGHAALMTAYMNDVNPEMVFGQQVYAYGEKSKDVLLAMSTSGNSINIVNAAKVAKVIGIKTIAVTGKKGGELKNLCDHCICLPEKETFKIQELILPVYHAVCAMLEEYFFGDES